MSLTDTIAQVKAETEALLRPETSAPNSAFSTKLPTLQLAWDSTSLGALKRCPRYYQNSILDGRVSTAENVHLTFGILIHKAHELYDWLRVANEVEHKDAMLQVVRYMFASTFDTKTKRPWFSDMPEKNRETLVRTVIWGLTQYAADPVQTIKLKSGRPAVEVPFRFEPGIQSLNTEEEFLICGHLDRVGEWQERLWILDYKTTRYALDDRYFEKYTPNNQMTIYYAAGQIVIDRPIEGIIVDAMQVGATFSRFRREPIHRSPRQLEAWLTDLTYWLRLAEGFAKANYWPMNDEACGLYGGCPYRQVCSENPGMRSTILDRFYERRVWDPLKVREL